MPTPWLEIVAVVALVIPFLLAVLLVVAPFVLPFVAAIYLGLRLRRLTAAAGPPD